MDLRAGDVVRCRGKTHPGVTYEGTVFRDERHGWCIRARLLTLIAPPYSEGRNVAWTSVDLGMGLLPLSDPGWNIEIVRSVPRPCEGGGI